ncbi:hypothetical protein ACFYZ5_15110 [Streptomyces chartreusis]|uniref:hypothetical protein n=1 Tax=Streptomyces chartreusis TaxID=1969 RepID=UPI0036D1DDA1
MADATRAGTDPSKAGSVPAAAEHPSEHPLARAIFDAARERALPLTAAQNFTSTPGRGVTVTLDGHTVRRPGAIEAAYRK